MKYDILRTQPTKENPFIIENYPYGFKKTLMKVWVESNKKGDRVLRKTQNPKTLVWNKPKASTYEVVQVLGINKDNGYIETAIRLSPYYKEEFKENVKVIRESVDLNEFQEKAIKSLDMAFKLGVAKNNAMDKAGIENKCYTQRFKHKITGEIVDKLDCFSMGEFEEYNGTPEELQEKEDQKANFLKFYDEELKKIGVKRK